MRTVTSSETQNRFGELIDGVQREPVTITRRGRPLAFVLSPKDLEYFLVSSRLRDRAHAEFEAFFALAKKEDHIGRSFLFRPVSTLIVL